MEVVETKTNLWEVLAGRAPGTPTGPADSDLWNAVNERLNPARSRPRLREGIEEVAQTSIRGQHYVMLRSPDERESAYLRLTPEEVELAHRMDGTRTVAVLVGEFSTITGRLAPDQVMRLVADLAGNRMLKELPVDVFHTVGRRRSGPLLLRLGRGLVATLRGRRVVLANPDRAMDWLYRVVGRFLFNRVAVVLLVGVSVAGMVVFARTWAGGAESVFLVGGSYATGAAVLLGLNVIALAFHEVGHSMAAKRARRRVPAMGVLLYFGLPSVFVDTTDVWMAGRKARMLTSAAGPVGAFFVAAVIQLIGLAFPPLAPIGFKIAFVWYLNSLFNLNPLMALDGYYLFMDWLEVPNLRPRAMAMIAGWIRRRRPRWSDLDREGRMIAVYAILALGWLVVMLNLMVRIYRDRVTGLATGLWNSGPGGRILLVVVVSALVAPLLHLMIRLMARWTDRLARRRAERGRIAQLPQRVDALRGSALGALPEAHLVELGEEARWAHPRRGDQVVGSGPPPTEALIVVEGSLEGRLPGDPPGTIRERARPGDLVGSSWLVGVNSLTWFAAGTRLLAVPLSKLDSALTVLFAAIPAGERDDAERVFLEAPVVAAPRPSPTTPVMPRVEGAVDQSGYPPLDPRPGEPPPGDDEVDRRLLRSLLVLLLVLLLLALGTGFMAFATPTPWAEMPERRVLLTVERGEAEASMVQTTIQLREGDRRFLREGDMVEVGERSSASLTFAGGGRVLLCSLSRVEVGGLQSGTVEPIQPNGALLLERGVLIADTFPGTPAFLPLSLVLIVGDDRVANSGGARFVVSRGAIQVTAGEVWVNGVLQDSTDAGQACPPGSADSNSPVTTTTLPSTTSIAAETTTTAVSATTTVGVTTTTLGTTTTQATPTTTVPSTTTAPTTTTIPPTTTTAPQSVPQIAGVRALHDPIWEEHSICIGQGRPLVSTVTVQVTGAESVLMLWNVGSLAGEAPMQQSAEIIWTANLGPFPLGTVGGTSQELPINVTIIAANGAGQSVANLTVTLVRCLPLPQ